jgi:predicted RNA binding protein YcfA (HicA-like mRNA interferase family)
MATDSTRIISKLKKDRWSQAAWKDSHAQFKHSTKKCRVTVPHPKKDLPMGTIISIEKQSGVKLS